MSGCLLREQGLVCGDHWTRPFDLSGAMDPICVRVLWSRGRMERTRGESGGSGIKERRWAKAADGRG